MKEIEKILFELDYISYIFNDVKKTYYDLDDKKYIYQAYNYNDLKLLFKIVKLSSYIMNYISCYLGDNFISSSYFNNIVVEHYNKINDDDINYMYFETLFNYRYERDLYFCKDVVNEYIHKIENDNYY